MRTTKPRAGHPEQDAGQAVTTLYQMHYRPLVRLAVLLVSDLATAEDIVQDSFAAVHGRWHALPDAGTALCYLHRSVVEGSRSAPQLPPAGDMRAHGPAPHGSAVVSALQSLPVRQREVMVLRYFADLPESEIASATGMSTAAVRSHADQAMSSLAAALHAAAG